MSHQTISQAIADKAAESGLGWAALGRKFGVSRASAQKWGRGHSVPDVRHWPALAEWLGISALEVRSLVEAQLATRTPQRLENQSSQWGGS